MRALIFIRLVYFRFTRESLADRKSAQRSQHPCIPSQIQNRYTTFDNSSPTSIARCAFPKPAVRRTKEEKRKCERALKLQEVRRKVREGRCREGQGHLACTCVCVCMCVYVWERGSMCLCRTKGKSGMGGRAGWERGMGSVLITSTDFNGGFLYAVYFVHDLYYFEPRWSSMRSI